MPQAQHGVLAPGSSRSWEQHPAHISLWWDYVPVSILPTLLSMRIHLGFLIHVVYKFFGAIPVLITQCLMSGPAMPSQGCQCRRIRTISGALLSWPQLSENPRASLSVGAGVATPLPEEQRDQVSLGSPRRIPRGPCSCRAGCRVTARVARWFFQDWVRFLQFEMVLKINKRLLRLFCN